jgi:uncharacterized protein (TIGR02145 family)
VTGLTNGTAYTFTVAARNLVGPSEPSAPSAAVTPAPAVTVPDAPTGVVATAGDGSASVAFVAPTNNGGSDIIGYYVTSDPTGSSLFLYGGPGATSPIIVSGLTNGTAYTFTVAAFNLVGPSIESAPSAAVTPAAPLSVCPGSQVIDANENIYNTVAIGTQCWMQENLKVTKYNNGDDIPDETFYPNWGNLTTGARSEYVASGVPDYVSDYGYLYNWYAATDSRKICPTGWHVPTDSDWNKLVKSIDSAADTTGTETQSSSAGTLMKKSDVLWTTNSGTNTSGFSALPGGYRDFDGSFFDIRYSAFLWSATESDYSSAWYRNLNRYDGDVYRNNYYKSVGASVRCLKD